MPNSSSDLVPIAPFSPPDSVPSMLPVETRVQLLPFEALSWENFERLCHRLTEIDGDYEHCSRYGRQGDAQEGIDIFSRQANGHYHCLQAKRHRTFSATQLREAVDIFLEGSWASRTNRFTIAVQALLRSTAVQDEIERQAARLGERNIVFSAIDGENLTTLLRGHPDLIDDFFGRPWVIALLGQQAAASLGKRLDGEAFARVRSQLARIYEAQFQFIDPGSFGSIRDEDGRPELTLLERFLKPDVLVRELAYSPDRNDALRDKSKSNASATPMPALSTQPVITRSRDHAANSRMRRIPAAEWLADGQRLVVLGDAGCGKSTLLRVIAIDLLNDQQHFPELASRWGQHLPIYIPFARWSSLAARDGNPIGIKEFIRRSLEQHLTSSLTELIDQAIDEKRVLLLIDGLDEWSTEQAARATLSSLVTSVEAHNIPAIVSGRLNGLSRIGTLPNTWKRGTVAPLSTSQQTTIAGRWFGRYVATTRNDHDLKESVLRTNRFMGELARDASLGVLAEVPLLLIGLVTLALRDQILPRTKGDIYNQLVRILLEAHPKNRETASGDTESRFRHATDPDLRRAAIARLAFAMREQADGAGMPLQTARQILRTYLISPESFALPFAEATASANEILSVNAETQGLIVEKSTDEIGFVHASFEEYLSAEHIGGWPFSDIECFVRKHSGEGRWRNVISNLLSGVQRRNEFDQLVALIELPGDDELTDFHRQTLLGDIAFSASSRASTTAKKLALSTMRRVENEDWMPARREALASVLKGLPDPLFKTEIEQRLNRWLPMRHADRASLISAFASWQPTSQLQDLLFEVMHDEDQSVQRAAAASYAKLFSHSVDAYRRVIYRLASVRNLTAAVALLECLTHGWPHKPEAISLFEKAWAEHSSEMGLVGALGLAMNGVLTTEARDFALESQSFWSGTPYEYQVLAMEMLLRYWPNDEMLIESALACLNGDFDSIWERSNAITYLMEAPTDNIATRSWILTELRSNHSFTIRNDTQVWSQVGRFASTDPEIRAAANAYWCEPKNRLINMYKLPSYVAQNADAPIATVLIQILRERRNRFDRYWALQALLKGWGRNHPAVEPAIDELRILPDDDLIDLVALIPEIVIDKTTARKRLIHMGSNPKVRRDLLAIGLEKCGSDSTDNEAVASILTYPNQVNGAFDAHDPLFRAFGAHPDVRTLARSLVKNGGTRLALVASNYVDDNELTSELFAAVQPLPADLRTQIVEVSATGAAGTALETALSQGMKEIDPDIRARMVISYHSGLQNETREQAKEALLAGAVSVGVHYQAVRAAALAGLAAMGELKSLAALYERGKPIELETGSSFQPIVSVERLICERFDDFQAAFGEDLGRRLNSFGSTNRLAEVLSASPSASPSAKAAFLDLAERGLTPHTARALRALGAERPNSEMLLNRCWDALEVSDQRNDRAMINAEIALVLREHFSGNMSVRERLAKRFVREPSTQTAAPLAIFAPDAVELSLPPDFESLGHHFADCAVALHIAAHRSDSVYFAQLLEASVTRRWFSEFDAQHVANLAVEERLQRDSELEYLLTRRIDKDVDPSVSGSFARYLAAAGRLNSEARTRVLDLLKILKTEQSLPVAGYDAISDQWRAARSTLLDAISAG